MTEALDVHRLASSYQSGSCLSRISIATSRPTLLGVSEFSAGQRILVDSADSQNHELNHGKDRRGLITDLMKIIVRVSRPAEIPYLICHEGVYQSEALG
ncbi:MAG: hypothetical protein OSA98_02200 [Rubripirellula sp.]|nr:hypothetical protein [Rubripirellula sp.]